ncbi:MAG: sialidase family protein [Candidatus Hydrogenedentes bacterium]|nr:sialidase family protein [Candidatus Hydrogenedentota bacterium]
MQTRHRIFCLAIALAALFGQSYAEPAIVKEKDIVLYSDARFYSAFPSIVQRPDGELIVAFRRAPERQYFGEPNSNHTDPNSYLVLIRSNDNAATWTSEPELIFAHPFGGSQDPCMTQLRDGSIVCSSYGWAQLRGDAAEKFSESMRHGEFVFMGGYLLRSTDAGKSWSAPIIPPNVPGNVVKNVFNEPCPAYNRGPMWESRDGTLFWAIASQTQLNPRIAETHLLASRDGGLTWEYRTPIAQDEKASFNETALIETQKGDLIAFMRTADFDDRTVMARSTDGGKSFEKWIDTGFQGHPHCATVLPDGRILLVYGYRHAPFGIRARVLDPDATNIKEVEEIILRDDGGNSDLGYPWVTAMADGKYLVVYYFNKENGTRHIAGSIVAVR